MKRMSTVLIKVNLLDMQSPRKQICSARKMERNWKGDLETFNHKLLEGRRPLWWALHSLFYLAHHSEDKAEKSSLAAPGQLDMEKPS